MIDHIISGTANPNLLNKSLFLWGLLFSCRPSLDCDRQGKGKPVTSHMLVQLSDSTALLKFLGIQGKNPCRMLTGFALLWKRGCYRDLSLHIKKETAHVGRQRTQIILWIYRRKREARQERAGEMTTEMTVGGPQWRTSRDKTAEITQSPDENYLLQDLFNKFKPGTNTNPGSAIFVKGLL